MRKETKFVFDTCVDGWFINQHHYMVEYGLNFLGPCGSECTMSVPKELFELAKENKTLKVEISVG